MPRMRAGAGRGGRLCANRTQRRCLKRNRHLSARFLPLDFKEEHYALYAAISAAAMPAAAWTATAPTSTRSSCCRPTSTA